ncbi:hypothetical protein SAMN05421806_102109 [Streptomyces indicus]|uniref:Uncharacterized protein n=1 Tax=Streptomyces indicus TaxID=417292 RepID=A0A1G8VXI6_9ACTN|nr:hypothetical protein SAMN05421806_102109 [Streptomyces indicus]
MERAGFQDADHLARRHLVAFVHECPYRLEGRTQGRRARAAQFDGHHTPARDAAGEGDRPGGRSADLGAGGGGEVDSSVPGPIAGRGRIPGAQDRRAVADGPGAIAFRGRAGVRGRDRVRDPGSDQCRDLGQCRGPELGRG